MIFQYHKAVLKMGFDDKKISRYKAEPCDLPTKPRQKNYSRIKRTQGLELETCSTENKMGLVKYMLFFVLQAIV